MHRTDELINQALYENCHDDGIVVMDGFRNYSVWMSCRNYKGDWIAPTCFGKGYRSRHAAKAAFAACGGLALPKRALIL